MSIETVTSVVVALFGVLGVKEVWEIWKKKIDVSSKLKQSASDNIHSRIVELEKKLDELYEENAELLAKVARLEERLIHTAKDRVKTRISGEY